MTSSCRRALLLSQVQPDGVEGMAAERVGDRNEKFGAQGISQGKQRDDGPCAVRWTQQEHRRYYTSTSSVGAVKLCEIWWLKGMQSAAAHDPG